MIEWTQHTHKVKTELKSSEKKNQITVVGQSLLMGKQLGEETVRAKKAF